MLRHVSPHQRTAVKVCKASSVVNGADKLMNENGINSAQHSMPQHSTLQ